MFSSWEVTIQVSKKIDAPFRRYDSGFHFGLNRFIRLPVNVGKSTKKQMARTKACRHANIMFMVLPQTELTKFAIIQNDAKIICGKDASNHKNSLSNFFRAKIQYESFLLTKMLILTAELIASATCM